MTIDQKEKFRHILQALSNGKLEMGRMDLQKALDYFHLAHARAQEYAEFIKINDIDKDPPCQKCEARKQTDEAAATHTRMFDSAVQPGPVAISPLQNALRTVTLKLSSVLTGRKGGYEEAIRESITAIDQIANDPPTQNAPQSTGRDFSWALLHLKAGHAVARKGWWNAQVGWTQRLFMASSLPPGSTENVIFNKSYTGLQVPWAPKQQASILADDWELL